jgi:dihydrofolate reductase
MIKLIIATNNQNIIGIGNKLPWSIPKEMAHFKKQTMGQTVVMGRKTWDSIPAKYKPLIGRHNIVLSSSGNVTGADETFSDIDSLLLNRKNFTVMGGKEIYTQFLERNLVDSIMMSIVTTVIDDVSNAVIFNLPTENFYLSNINYFKEFNTYHYLKDKYYD